LSGAAPLAFSPAAGSGGGAAAVPRGGLVHADGLSALAGAVFVAAATARPASSLAPAAAFTTPPTASAAAPDSGAGTAHGAASGSRIGAAHTSTVAAAPRSAAGPARRGAAGSAGNIAADALSRGRADEVVALCRAARIAPREVAAVGGQRALELVLGDAYPAAAPIDTFADVRFVPSLEPSATPRRGTRARQAAAAGIAPPPARRVSRRNPPMPHAGVRIGEARHPGPPKGAAPPVAVDDLDAESSGPIRGPGAIIASAHLDCAADCEQEGSSRVHVHTS
jgi:hypothetical protein